MPEPVTVKLPYEVLFRWDQAGNLRAAHIQFQYLTKEGETNLGDSVGPALSVAVAGAEGFPLADVLDIVQITALEALAVANAAIDKYQVELAAAQEALAQRQTSV